VTITLATPSLADLGTVLAALAATHKSAGFTQLPDRREVKRT
jgi:hypothetical protein